MTKKQTYYIPVTDDQLIEILHAVEVRVDILNDTVIDDLWAEGDSFTLTIPELKELRESVEKKIDRLVNTQLLYTQLKGMVKDVATDLLK